MILRKQELRRTKKVNKEDAYWSYDRELERQIAVDILQRLDAIFLDQLFDEKNNKWFECEDMITQLLKEKYNNGK
jgi:uncharacterized Zn finger protein